MVTDDRVISKKGCITTTKYAEIWKYYDNMVWSPSHSSPVTYQIPLAKLALFKSRTTISSGEACLETCRATGKFQTITTAPK